MLKRILAKIEGAVQGVGFRPFVYRLAQSYGLKGTVKNTSEGVIITAEGETKTLMNFINDLKNNYPPIANVTNFEFRFSEPIGFKDFRIIKTSESNNKSVLLLPDLAICSDCTRELFDETNRRYLYPFINCTNCGPRFSIIEKIPYDRPNTVMKEFNMCNKCKEEYENPLDRRFHAQPIACPDCGPRVKLTDAAGNAISLDTSAIKMTAELIASGKIIAFKGLGGFQLLADASNPEAINNLRKRKLRQRKPFALMAKNIESIKEICHLNPEEEKALLSPQAPIVLLKRKSFAPNVSPLVAPANPYLGFMLPYTPLHLILFEYFHGIIIATSGNLSNEPMCIDNNEALQRLGGIADFFLMHNRRIARHMDDSIVRLMDNRIVILRRARGFAPMPILSPDNHAAETPVIIALGAQLKNTVSVKIKNKIFTSQHLGDLSNEVSYKAFKNIYRDLPSLYNVQAEILIKDLHPDYLSGRFSEELNIKSVSVQHHLAHVVSCYAENYLEGKALGVAWDGTGLGLDGTIWGGEFFVFDSGRFSHIAQIKQFLLPGGNKAIKEPPRSALGLLFSYFGKDFVKNFIPLSDFFGKDKLEILIATMEKKINSFATSSAGRLFDAISFLLSLSFFNEFEGEAAMSLEFEADKNTTSKYSFNLIENKITLINLKPMLQELLSDLSAGVSSSIISGKFHNTLAEIILKVAEKFGISQIVLSGGCFQNKLLLEKTLLLLKKNGFTPFIHSKLPPNDGGISFGQLFAYRLKQTDPETFLETEIQKLHSKIST